MILARSRLVPHLASREKSRFYMYIVKDQQCSRYCCILFDGPAIERPHGFGHVCEKIVCQRPERLSVLVALLKTTPKS
jgi:hypothetical protein